MLLKNAKFYELYLLHYGLNVVNFTTPLKFINFKFVEAKINFFLFTGTQTKYDFNF